MRINGVRALKHGILPTNIYVCSSSKYNVISNCFQVGIFKKTEHIMCIESKETTVQGKRFAVFANILQSLHVEEVGGLY